MKAPARKRGGFCLSGRRKKGSPVKVQHLFAIFAFTAGVVCGADLAVRPAPEKPAADTRLTDDEIRKTYDLLADYHARYLEKQGVKLPELVRPDGQFTQVALTLVYLAQGYPDTKTVTKSELTEFVRIFHPQATDVQQARHLAAQAGWYVLSGTRNDDRTQDLPPGTYRLVSLTEAYPGFSARRREDSIGPDDWQRLKESYGNRCASCGSREGESHVYWPETLTVLQKGHRDPAKPLGPGNVIPQCLQCNQASRDFWVFDDKGRVVAVANPAVIDRSSEAVQRQIYERLRQKFDGPDGGSAPENARTSP